MCEVSGRAIAQVLSDLDQSRFHAASRRCLAIGILMSVLGHLVVFVGLAVILGDFAPILANELVLYAAMMSIGFFALVCQSMLLRLRPPRHLGALWVEAPKVGGVVKRAFEETANECEYVDCLVE